MKNAGSNPVLTTKIIKEMEYEEFLKLASEKLINEFKDDENKHNSSLTVEQYFYQECRYFEEKLSKELIKQSGGGIG